MTSATMRQIAHLERETATIARQLVALAQGQATPDDAEKLKAISALLSTAADDMEDLRLAEARR